MKGMNKNPALLTPCNLEGDRASFNKGDCMINYRRFARRRLLSMQVSGFHTADFSGAREKISSDENQSRHVKSSLRPIVSRRVNSHPVGAARELVTRSNT